MVRGPKLRSFSFQANKGEPPRCKVKAKEGTATREAKAAETVNCAASPDRGEKPTAEKTEEKVVSMTLKQSALCNGGICFSCKIARGDS